jgi:hypothetical protein
MPDRDGDSTLEVEDLQKMRFHEELMPDITWWISNISSSPNKWTVADVLNHILIKVVRRVPGFWELLYPAFYSESLDMPCTVDNNYLCTVTSCTRGPFYKRIGIMWPGGRQELWELHLGQTPYTGEPYIDQFIRSPHQDIGFGNGVVGPAAAEADVGALLRQMERLT